MQPTTDPLAFLQHVQDYQAQKAATPSSDQQFVMEQFQGVVSALQAATKAMTSFMRTYHPQVTVDNVNEVVTAVKELETSLKPSKQDNTDVIKAIKSLQTDIKRLPAAMPDSDQAVVESLNTLSNKLSGEIGDLLTAIHNQDLQPKITVPAPKVTVQPTPVTVEKPDFSEVVKALKDVKTEVKNKPVPGTPNVPTDPLIYYLPSDIDDAGTVQYYGYTDNRGAWYVRQFDTGASPKTIRFAFGQKNYTTNWTNRASLTYSVWGS